MGDGILDSLRRLPAPVRLLLLGSFINRVGTFVLIFLALYVKSRGYPATTSGLAVALYGAGYLIASIVGGQLADRVGRRSTIVISMTSSAVVLIALSQAESMTAILILGTLAGVASELYRPASAALISDLVPPADQLVAYGAYRFAINFGIAIGSILGGLLAETSFLALFLVDAAMSLAFASVALFGLPRDKPIRAKKRTEASIFTAIRADFPMIVFLLASAIVAIVYAQALGGTFSLQVVAYGHSALIFGVLWAVNSILIILFELPLLGLLRRYPKQWVVTIAFLVEGLGFGLIGVSGSLTVLVLAIAVITLGEMMLEPIALAYIAERAPPHLRGRYQGIYVLVEGQSFVLGPLIGAAVFSASHVAVWIMCACLGTIATVMMSASNWRARQGEATPAA